MVPGINGYNLKVKQKYTQALNSYTSVITVCGFFYHKIFFNIMNESYKCIFYLQIILQDDEV